MVDHWLPRLLSISLTNSQCGLTNQWMDEHTNQDWLGILTHSHMNMNLWLVPQKPAKSCWGNNQQGTQPCAGTLVEASHWDDCCGAVHSPLLCQKFVGSAVRSRCMGAYAIIGESFGVTPSWSLQALILAGSFQILQPWNWIEHWHTTHHADASHDQLASHWTMSLP